MGSRAVGAMCHDMHKNNLPADSARLLVRNCRALRAGDPDSADVDADRGDDGPDPEDLLPAFAGGDFDVSRLPGLLYRERRLCGAAEYDMGSPGQRRGSR